MRNIGISLLAAAALAFPAAAKSASKDADAQVTCKDGSTSKKGRGSCSHHGGVADASAAPAQKESRSAARSGKSDTAKEPDQGSSKSSKSGGIFGGLFGKKSDTSQG